MVQKWGGRAIRWGILGLTALIVVVYFVSLFFTLSHRVKVAEAGKKADDQALAVANAQITQDRAIANLHVTVTQPPPQVTVTVAPGQPPGVNTGPSSSRVVMVPSPFVVPGPIVTSSVAPSKSTNTTVTVQECPVFHLLFLCL